MNELRTLLSLELRSLYGINQFLYTKDRKEKNRCYLLIPVWVILVAMVFFYVGGQVYGLCLLGMGDIVPAYLTVLASMLIVVFGFFTAGNRIFGQKGYDILASLPVRSASIVISRFLAMYAEYLALTLLILLPGAAVYGFCQKPGIGYYLLTLVGALFTPALPLVAATLLGSAVLAVSSRMKNQSVMQSVLMVGLVILVLVGSFRMGPALEEMTPEAFASLIHSVRETFEGLYPPALWLGSGILQGDFFSLGLFILVSAAAAGFTVFIVTANFHAILRRLQSVSAKHDYRLTTLQSRGMLKALYLRELKRYFASSIYVTNTIVGPIMGCILAVALAFVGVEGVQEMLMLPFDIAPLLPFVFAGVFCTMTTTSVSISMEGKQFWVIKSLPIPTKTLLDSKLLLNLSLMAPFYGVSVIALTIATKPASWDFLWLVLIPGAVILFSVVIGITVNLRFHSFDWEKDEVVVKQSLSAMLGGFAGFLISAFLGCAVYAAGFADTAIALSCLLILALTALLYRANNRKNLQEL